ATECARRACRMARTEMLADPEVLAGLTLARTRRMSGRPYLAARIVDELRRRAPPCAWIDWELALAGARTTAPAHPPNDRPQNGRAAVGAARVDAAAVPASQTNERAQNERVAVGAARVDAAAVLASPTNQREQNERAAVGASCVDVAA